MGDRFDLQEHVPLAPLTTLGVGGAARWFARVSTVEEVAAAEEWRAARHVPRFVLGGGSNLIVSDAGVAGLVMKVETSGIEFETTGEITRLNAGAGERWDRVVAAAVSRGLAGVECLSGIPGSVGGTPIQNVGAYGQEVADTIEAVTVFDAHAGTIVTIPSAECAFAYRASRFKVADAGRFVVLRVTFALRPGPPSIRYPDVSRWCQQHGIGSPTLADVREAVLAVRRSKGMVVDAADRDSRSVGSFFMNPVVPASVHDALARVAGVPVPAYAQGDGRVKIPAAWLIERAGFEKGFVDGHAGISTKHPLAIVNRGGATARDVTRLAVRVKQGVAERFHVMLGPEPMFVGFDADDPDVTYLRDTTPCHLS